MTKRRLKINIDDHPLTLVLLFEQLEVYSDSAANVRVLSCFLFFR